MRSNNSRFSRDGRYGGNRSEEHGYNRPKRQQGRPFGNKNNYGNGRGEGFDEDGEESQKPYRTRGRSKTPPRTNTRAPKTPEEGIRLNRYLANAGLCSRRDADVYIKAGVVKINGKVVEELGVRVMPGDVVRFNDETVRSEKKVYILLNKPKNTVTTLDDPQGRRTVVDLVAGACKERVYPVGRLDRNTMGVLLLTNDGELADRLTHPRFNKKKLYHVFLNKPLDEEHRRQILDGFVLDDGFIRADALEYVEGGEGRQVGIEIHSGRNRIVRRIFEHFGYSIDKLDRVQFAGLTKAGVPRGGWRFLTEREVAVLKSGHYD